METKDTKKEEKRAEREIGNLEANELRADAKKKRNHNNRKVNNLWLWLGIIILIFILIWWLWTIGIFEDTTGITNG